MKTFVCANCGVEVRRPAPPLSCQACGQQRIGLFREKPAGAPPAPAAPIPAAPISAAPVAPGVGAPPPPGMVPPAPVIPGAPPATPPVPQAPAAPVAPAPVAPIQPATPPAPVVPAPVTPAPPVPAAPASAAPAPPAAPQVPSQPAAPAAPSAPVQPAPPAPAAPIPVAPAVPQVPSQAVTPSVPPTPEPAAPQAPVQPVAQPPSVPPTPAPVVPAAPPEPVPVQTPPTPAPPAVPAFEVPPEPAPVETPPPPAVPAFELPPEPAPVETPPEPVAAQPPKPPARPAPRPAPTVPPTPEPPPTPVPEQPAAPAAVEPPAAPAQPVAQPAAAATPPPAAAPASERAAPKPAAEKRVPGKVMWVYPKQIPGQDYSTAPIRSCPVSLGKNQFAVCFGRKLIALDWKNSGLEPLWEYDCGAHIPGSPVMGNDGLIRVHSGDGWLHCIDQEGGRAWESVPVGEPLGWAAPVVDSDGNAYVSAYAGGLLRVTGRGNFNNKPFFRSRQKFDSTGLIFQGVLYVGSEDAYVYAIPLDGETSKNAWDQLENRGKTEWFINSAPALAPDSTIVVGGRDENLYGFHRDGQLAWKIHIPGQMLASPVIGGNGDIFVGVSIIRSNHPDKGKLVCVDGNTHRVRWEYDAQGAVESTPVIGDDEMVYFGDNAGHIHAMRPDGECMWRANVRRPVRSAGAIVGANRLVFGADNGTLMGILCSSGGVSRKGWAKYMAKIR